MIFDFEQEIFMKCDNCKEILMKMILKPNETFKPDPKMEEKMKNHIMKGHRVDVWFYINGKIVTHTYFDYSVIQKKVMSMKLDDMIFKDALEAVNEQFLQQITDEMKNE